MKHTLRITSIVLLVFLLSQFIGIAIVYKYIDRQKTMEQGKAIFKELPFGERPPLEEKNSFISIMLSIFIGTALLLLLIKFNLTLIWKIWFLIAIVISLSIAGSAFIMPKVAVALALFLGLWKIFRPNVWVQNITEIFMYGGLAAIFVPVINLQSAIILLILISLYDAYAVWKSKHMITLAQSQTKANIFAGLLIPYSLPNTKNSSEEKGTLKVKTQSVPSPVRTAVLGGGDMGFPLIFAGVILKEWGLLPSLIIPFFAAAGLAVIFWKGEPHKFYPAMPFISVGCFVGMGVSWLLFHYL